MATTNLHQRREQIPMCKVRHKTRLIGSTGHGDGRFDCFEPYIDCQLVLHILLRWNIQSFPLRIMPSNTATKSEITWSTSSSPASTVMISELGLVYLFLRTPARKTVKVYTFRHCAHELSSGTHLQRICIRGTRPRCGLADCAREQLPSLRLFSSACTVDIDTHVQCRPAS